MAQPLAIPSGIGDIYVNAARAAEFAGPGKFRGIMRNAPIGGDLHPLDDRINRRIAKVRAKVAHAGDGTLFQQRVVVRVDDR